MATGDENLARAVAQFLLEEGILRDQELYGFMTTPIERLFFKALCLHGTLETTFLNLKIGFDNLAPFSDLGIEGQHDIDGWRVDFLFRVVSEHGVVSHLVVECDGHDYHERTKEQAQRDRERDRRMQEKGYTIYRFTGSELHRDAFGCARQVYRWAHNAVWKKGD